MKRRATIIWPCYTRAGHRGSERTTAGARASRWLDTRLTRYSNLYRRTCVALCRRRRQYTPLEIRWWSVRQKRHPGNKSVLQFDRGSISPTRQPEIGFIVPSADSILVSKTRLTCLQSVIDLRVTSFFPLPHPLYFPFLLRGARITSMYDIERERTTSIFLGEM